MRITLLPVAFALASPLLAQKTVAAPWQLEPQTVVAGTVSGVWTVGGSPYRLVGRVVADELVIEAGVRVLGSPDASLVVEGSLQVNGTAAQPVELTSSAPRSRWGGLEFDRTRASSRLRHAIVSRSFDSGVAIVDSVVRLEHVTLEDNVAANRGGGLRANVKVGDLVMSDCRVSNNASLRSGGGLAVELVHGSLVLVRCELTNNAVNAGISSSVFSVAGGGLAVDRAQYVEITDSRIEGNTIDTGSTSSTQHAEGGGLSIRDAELIMTRCIVSSNRAWSIVPTQRGDSESMGGGLFFEGAGKTAQVRNSLFSGNQTALEANGFVQAAAGVGVGAGSLSLSNCTVARNHMILGFGWTPDYGDAASGVLASIGASVSVTNSILYGNTYSGFLSLWYPPAQHQLVSAFNAEATATYTDVQGGHAGLGNLYEPPQFQGQGTTYTDLSLEPSSVCVDAGNPEPLYNDVAFPPSLGSVRNDMGMNGGPLAAGWVSAQ